MGKSKKKNNEVKKLVVILLIAIVAIVGIVVLTTGSNNINESDYTEIKFSDMYDVNGALKDVSQKLNLLNGKKVLLSGYMAEQSPVDESFIYLVSQPYVVCPFCTVGDITKLEVMTVMMANGTGISFRNSAVNVYGTLEVSPKVDTFGYTTQFRILADRITNIEETEGNAEVNTYYQSLNEAGMIFDIQTLQMKIDSVANPDSMKMYYSTNDPEKVIDAIKKDTSFDFADQAKQYGMSGQSAFVTYIKECPFIISANAITNNNEKLMALNDELIEIYNKEIPVLEKVMALVEEIKTQDLTKERKVEIYNELLSYKDINLEYFNQFNAWNNKLRE